MTLRSRVAVAAGLGVFVVLAVVSTVLYLFYAASLHSRVDAALVDAAEQASGIAARVKQTANGHGTAADFTTPVAVGRSQVQLLPGPNVAGRLTAFGKLSEHDVAVANHVQPAYFTTVDHGGQRLRLYTAGLPNTTDGSLVRTSRAESADDGAKRRAATLLAALTFAASGTVFGLARLTAGRLLRPIADLTAAAEIVTRTRDPGARLGEATLSDVRPGGHVRPRRPDEVARLRLSFDTMLGELERSADRQRQLVGDASHELRTPLTSLTTNLELLEDGAGLADPEAPELVRAARVAAGELDALIVDLLDLARYGESPPQREDVRLDLLASNAVHRIRMSAPRIIFTVTLHPVLIHADPAAVDHAVSNLLDNAIKWSPPGGPIDVAVLDGSVHVTDHGPGINPTDLPHIFERFYRSATARGRPGAGLGLAIVARVTEANGGAVTVHSGPSGSTFTLSFASQAPSLDRRDGNHLAASEPFGESF